MAPLESFINHNLDVAPIELKITPWFKGWKFVRFYRRWEYKEPSLELRILLDKSEDPIVVNPLSTRQVLVNCMLNEDSDAVWRLTFNKTENGELVLRCNGNVEVLKVCDSLCGYDLLDVDRFTLSKDFGRGYVDYIHNKSGTNTYNTFQ